jgi:hypothetical protein
VGPGYEEGRKTSEEPIPEWNRSSKMWVCPGVKAEVLSHAPFSHQTSLPKYKFKDKVIKNITMISSQHYIPHVESSSK